MLKSFKFFMEQKNFNSPLKGISHFNNFNLELDHHALLAHHQLLSTCHQSHALQTTNICHQLDDSSRDSSKLIPFRIDMLRIQIKKYLSYK